ncbi:MAG: hypothetical protein JST16_07420 [Bdellovibrionales bacterium]|nr:hypothetical protein [Bdellovibrionales bacterium]
MQTKRLTFLMATASLIVLGSALTTVRAQTPPAPGDGLPSAAKAGSEASANSAAPTATSIINTPSPSVDDQEVDTEGSIADTNVMKVMESKELLKPEYGFEDLFLTKGSSAILDLQNLPGYTRKDLTFLSTTQGVVADSRRDAVSGGERIVAGNVAASTQILIYENKSSTEGRPERGKLLKVYRVTVTNEDLITLMQELKALIGDVEGLEIRIVGSQVIVDGAVLVPKEMRRVLAVTGKFMAEKKPVINLAEISPVTMKLLGEKMEEEIAGGKDRPRDVKVKVLNGRFFLEGSVDTDWQKAEAEKICLAYVSEKYSLEPKDPSGKLEVPKFEGLGECISMIRRRAGQPQEPDPILHVRVDFVTLSRSYMKLFDFKWAPGLTTSGNSQYSTDTGKFLTSFTATISSLFPSLDTAASHGYARVLKSAQLLVRDGEKAGDKGAPPEATLNETLQLYVLVQGTANTPASYQAVPVNTKVSVRAKSVPGTDKINMDVYAVQSELKSAGTGSSSDGSGGGPTTYSTDVKTSIVVSNGESAALGGLITERRNVDITRDPANEKDAAGNKVGFHLFELGRSHSFNDDKTQFIIFVTPTKLRSPTEGTETLKRKFRLRK